MEAARSTVPLGHDATCMGTRQFASLVKNDLLWFFRRVFLDVYEPVGSRLTVNDTEACLVRLMIMESDEGHDIPVLFDFCSYWATVGAFAFSEQHRSFLVVTFYVEEESSYTF